MMNYNGPIMSYTSLQEGVFDTANEEIKNHIQRGAYMKTYRNVKDLSQMLLNVIDSIIENNYMYAVKLQNTTMLIKIKKGFDHFQYIKIEGLDKNSKLKIKDSIIVSLPSSDHHIVSKLFNGTSYSFYRPASCILS